jgi:hypothetical protein
MARMPSQSGAVSGEVRREDRLRARREAALDPIDVDLEGVGCDVDEDGHEPAAHHRRDVGREGEGRGDDLVARFEAEQLDREVERRRARVAHHAAPLPEGCRDEALHLAHVLADAHRRRAAAQHRRDRRDLLLVVDAARVFDAHAVLRALFRVWVACRDPAGAGRRSGTGRRLGEPRIRAG